MSFIFSRALAEEFFQADFSGIDAFAPLSVIPTPKPSLSPGRTTEHLRLSRFGMTFELLTADHGAELLTSWLEGFHVKTSASQAEAMDSTASVRVCGQKWRGSFAKYDHDSSSWKTHQCSLLGGLDEFSETWPRWGSMRNGESFLRPMSELPTFASASGSSVIYPTPCTVDTGSFFNQSASPNAAKRPTLGAMAKHNLWPTPTVCGNYNRPGASKTSGMGLATAVRMWPTPTAGNSHSGGRLDEWGGSRSRAKMRELVSQEELTGPLSPTFPEWLMGWPIGHTELKPLATDRFQSWLQQHGKF